ncbi:MAG: hypothetical protein AB7S40_10185, partial [Bacteroidales bacterium]
MFSDRARVIHPPFRRILFRPSEIWNDQLLEKEYAKVKGLSHEVAKEEISDFVKKLKAELNISKSIRIPDFGTMRATEQNNYFFVADKDLFNYLETFGLDPVSVKVMPKRGIVEELTGKPVSNFFKSDNVKKSVGRTEETQNKDEKIIVKEQNKEEGPEQEELEIEVKEGEISSQEPSQEQDHKLPDPDISPEKEPILEQELLQEQEPLQEQEQLQAPEVSQQQVFDNKESVETERQETKGSSKFVRSVVITLSIIFLIILAIVVLYLFRDDLKPMWEWLLYSKEERELLHQLQ